MLILWVLIIITYFVIYVFCVYPLHRLDKYQTKDEVLNTNFTLLKGVVDNSEFSKIKPNHENKLSFWYIYTFILTKEHSIVCVIWKPNVFSDKVIITIYGRDHIHDTTFNSSISMKWSDMDVTIKDGVATVTCSHLFKQHFDTNTNKLMLDIQAPPYSALIHMNIKDYSTNIPGLLPQLSYMSYFSQFAQSNCPNVWGSDNGMFGDITNSTINGIQGNSGTTWTDNMYGFNSHYLVEYIWSIILTKDWIVYLLWFGNQDEFQNNKLNIRPIIIKDRRNDKMICCGIDSFQSTKLVPFAILDHVVQPKQMLFKCAAEKKIGEEIFDDYSVYFKCNGFEYSLTSVKNKTHRVNVVDYYDSHDVDESKLTSWEKEYYSKIRNTHYVEYISEVDVVINYEGEVQKFRTQSVVNSMFKIDSSIPSEIPCS
jgi:hypothetical protein